MGNSVWRTRYHAATIALPHWARERPERALYLCNADGKFEWYAWDRSTNTHRQATDRPDGTMLATIDPRGEWIWRYDDAKGNEKGRWVADPFDGSSGYREIDLPPAYFSGIAFGSEAIVVGSADKGIHTVHVARGDERPVPIYEHREAATVASIAIDESMFVLAHAEHGDNRNRALRVLDLDGRTVADLWDGPGKNLSPAGWSRVPGDHRLVVHHERLGVSRPSIWHPEEGELTELPLGEELPGEVTASWYPDASALLLVHLARGRAQLYRLPLSGTGAAGPPELLPSEPGMIAGAAVRPDGEIWYALSSSSTPSVVHCGAAVLQPPGEPAPAGVSYTDVEVGDVHAFLARPTTGSAPHPTVFEVHGGPAGFDADAFSPSVQAWVDHGFAVVLVNYRGSAGYGKAWRDAIVGKPGIREIEDIAAVRNQLVSDGVTDPGRVVLSGGSWGGYLTLLGLGRQPELWSLGISLVPLADLAAHYHQQSTPLQAYWRSLFGGTPDEIPEVLAEISPIEFADQVSAPLLIITGDNDPRCPLGQVLNYVSRLDSLGKVHELDRYDAGHGALVVAERIRHKERAIGFAAKHLGTPSPK